MLKSTNGIFQQQQQKQIFTIEIFQKFRQKFLLLYRHNEAHSPIECHKRSVNILQNVQKMGKNKPVRDDDGVHNIHWYCYMLLGNSLCYTYIPQM